MRTRRGTGRRDRHEGRGEHESILDPGDSDRGEEKIPPFPVVRPIDGDIQRRDVPPSPSVSHSEGEGTREEEEQEETPYQRLLGLLGHVPSHLDEEEESDVAELLEVTEEELQKMHEEGQHVEVVDGNESASEGEGERKSDGNDPEEIIEEEREEEEEEEEEEERNDNDEAGDEYAARFNRTPTVADIERWSQIHPSEVVDRGCVLDNAVVMSDGGPLPPSRTNLADFKVKKRLAEQWIELRRQRKEDETKPFSPLQMALFPILNDYRDVLYPLRTPENAQDLRELYVLHALNHSLKYRDRLLKNSAKCRTGEVEVHDQGFTRPKVLVVLPFRNSVVKFVDTLIKMMPKLDLSQILNKKRFYDEFRGEGDESLPHKPLDYQDTFVGNTDDCFRLGLSFTRKSIKLYTDFYSSDIIIASPLGLKLVMETKRVSFDFLSSLEIVIVDQADVFFMQNWDHMEDLFDQLNLMPQEMHGTDFSRIHPWALEGWYKYFRQTIVIAAHLKVEWNALFQRKCYNFKGRVRVHPCYDGSISQVLPRVKQVFHRLACPDLSSLPDARFEHFKNKVWPHLFKSVQTHVLLFVPSYFDYVRVRNFLKQVEEDEDLSFSAICEYSSKSEALRSRASFFHGKTRFLLCTERFHFFHRYRIRGTRNIFFYSLPEYAVFYPELINVMEESHTEECSCSVFFTRFDVFELERIVGSARVERMVNPSGKDAYLFY